MQRKSNQKEITIKQIIFGIIGGILLVVGGLWLISGCAAFMEGFGAGLGGAAGGVVKNVPDIADSGLNGGLITAIVTAGIAAIGGGGLGVRRIMRKRKEKNGNA